MKTASKLTGIALASAAAAMFAMAPVTATAGGTSKGHCVGVNACKGKSSCATAENKCKGHNACKGHGFVVVDKDTCDQLGGKFKTK